MTLQSFEKLLKHRQARNWKSLWNSKATQKYLFDSLSYIITRRNISDYIINEFFRWFFTTKLNTNTQTHDWLRWRLINWEVELELANREMGERFLLKKFVELFRANIHIVHIVWGSRKFLVLIVVYLILCLQTYWLLDMNSLRQFFLTILLRS